MENLPTDRTTSLAWAAGLFDAEGSVFAWSQRSRADGKPRLQREMAVSQSGVDAVPEVLVRFREIVGDGRFRGPVRGYLYYWYSARQPLIDEISASLWPWLGSEKRDQFRHAASAVNRPAPIDPLDPHVAPRSELAWAAGFFEGEGTLRPRGRHAELALPQATHDGAVPGTLLRFQRAVGGLGWIIGPFAPSNPWSKLPQFVWGSARDEHVQAVIAMLWPGLSTRRRREADRALQALKVGAGTRTGADRDVAR